MKYVHTFFLAIIDVIVMCLFAFYTTLVERQKRRKISVYTSSIRDQIILKFFQVSLNTQIVHYFLNDTIHRYQAIVSYLSDKL